MAASAPKSAALITLPASLRDGGEIRADELPGGVAAGVEQRSGIHAPVARSGALGHGVDAVGGGDQDGAVGRDQAALDGAPGLHQLGGDHDIDLARARASRPAPAPGRRPSLPEKSSR